MYGKRWHIATSETVHAHSCMHTSLNRCREIVHAHSCRHASLVLSAEKQYMTTQTHLSMHGSLLSSAEKQYMTTQAHLSMHSSLYQVQRNSTWPLMHTSIVSSAKKQYMPTLTCTLLLYQVKRNSTCSLKHAHLFCIKCKETVHAHSCMHTSLVSSAEKQYMTTHECTLLLYQVQRNSTCTLMHAHLSCIKCKETVHAHSCMHTCLVSSAEKHYMPTQAHSTMHTSLVTSVTSVCFIIEITFNHIQHWRILITWQI